MEFRINQAIVINAGPRVQFGRIQWQQTKDTVQFLHMVIELHSSGNKLNNRTNQNALLSYKRTTKKNHKGNEFSESADTVYCYYDIVSVDLTIMFGSKSRPYFTHKHWRNHSFIRRVKYILVEGLKMRINLKDLNWGWYVRNESNGTKRFKYHCPRLE